MEKIMKVLITGAKGFIGKNLSLAMKENGFTVLEYDQNSKESLSDLVPEVDVIIHLAGINRPLSAEEFYDGNTNLTIRLIDEIKKCRKVIPVVLSSSIQAEKENDYGKSKKMAEDQLFQFAKDEKNPVAIYRFANVFGKWCKPNYNSVVATFCYNIANDLPITISDKNNVIPFVYIDDVVNTIINNVKAKVYSESIMTVEPIYYRSLGELSELLYSFKESRNSLHIPNMQEGFSKKLYATYLSYLPVNQFNYPLVMHSDNRGSFTEIFKSSERGQISVNISKPGIVKGNHWHHTKNEKFLVVSGVGVIRFRKVDQEEIIEYFVSGEHLEVIDIPTGYTHNIENLGNTDLVTIMWANEVFDPENPDTYSMAV